MMERETELQRLIDESSIRRVLHTYPRALDRHDHALLASLFHADAIDEHGHYNGSASGFVDWMAEGAQAGVHWMHHYGTQIIEFQTDAIANVETYCIAMARRPDNGKLARTDGRPAANKEEILLRVRYLDKVEKRQGEWKIAHRRVVYSPCMVLEILDDFPLVDEMLREGGAGTDPVYQW